MFSNIANLYYDAIQTIKNLLERTVGMVEANESVVNQREISPGSLVNFHGGRISEQQVINVNELVSNTNLVFNYEVVRGTFPSGTVDSRFTLASRFGRLSNYSTNTFRANCIFPSNPQPGLLAEWGVSQSTGGIFLGYYFGGLFALRIPHSSVIPMIKLTITAAASGVENASIVIDNIPFTVPLTNAGGNLLFTAYEIAKFDYSIIGTEVYVALHRDDAGTVSVDFYILAFPSELTGTFSFTSATAAANFTLPIIGKSVTNLFVFPSQFSEYSKYQKLIDNFHVTQDLRLFEIEFSNRSDSPIKLFYFDPSTQERIMVHKQSTEGLYIFDTSYVVPVQVSLYSTIITGQPSFGDIAMGCESFCLLNNNKFSESELLYPRFSYTRQVTISGVPINVISFAVNPTDLYGNRKESEIIVREISISTLPNNNNPYNVTVNLYLNPVVGNGTLTDYPAYTVYGSGATSLIDEVSQTVTGGFIVKTAVVPSGNRQRVINSSDLFRLSRDDKLVLQANTDGGVRELFINLDFIEI